MRVKHIILFDFVEWEAKKMSEETVETVPVKFIRMPSEPPAKLVEMLSRKVFYNDDVEIGVGLTFICYREIHSYLESHGTVTPISD